MLGYKSWALRVVPRGILERWRKRMATEEGAREGGQKKKKRERGQRDNADACRQPAGDGSEDLNFSARCFYIKREAIRSSSNTATPLTLIKIVGCIFCRGGFHASSAISLSTSYLLPIPFILTKCSDPWSGTCSLQGNSAEVLLKGELYSWPTSPFLATFRNSEV